MAASQHDKATYLDGTLIQGVCVLLMTGCSFLVSTAVRPDPETGERFNHPLLIAWLCTTSFIFYLPAHFIQQARRRSKRTGEEEALLPPPAQSTLESTTPLTELGVVDTWKLAAPFAVLWYTTNACIDAALVLTTVSSLTLCFSSAGLWTLLLGAAFGIERLTKLKLAASFATILGVGLVCKGDAAASDFQQERILGNVLAITAAFGYAAFLIYYRKRLEGRPVSLTLFFGLVGATSLVVFTPLLVIFNFEGGVPIPTSRTITLCLLGDVLFSFTAGNFQILLCLPEMKLTA
ncbi:hypothetical protein P7C70_g5110, partial [Phenoliferia sp. Uapishka_3]